MKSFVTRSKTFLASEDGPTTTDYGILLALLLAGAISVMSNFGGRVDAIYNTINTYVP